MRKARGLPALLLLLTLPVSAQAQGEPPDPSATAPAILPPVPAQEAEPVPAATDRAGEAPAAAPDDAESADPADAAGTPDGGHGAAAVGKPKEAGKEPREVRPKHESKHADNKEKRKGPRPLLTIKTTDDDLLATWDRWRKALNELDMKAADQAEKDLLAVRDDMGVEALESLSTELLRAALVRRSAKDTAGAVQLAKAAVELSPQLPYAHLALAEALLLDSPFASWNPALELGTALKLLWTEPRYSRAALLDLGAGLLFALTATAVVLVLLLFLKRGRYFLHDLHHLFPRAAAKWQSAALALLFLSLPAVFRLGVAPFLMGLFAAVTLYVTPRERTLAGCSLLMLITVPFLGGVLAEKTAFAGTMAEDVYVLEHGGLEANAAVARVKQHITDEKAEFAELFALGRYLERRGKVDDAMQLFKQAADRRPNHARVLVNLANCLLIRGEVDNAAEVYQTATVADPQLAAAFYNLAKLRYRRASSMTDDSVGLELSQAQTALSSAHTLDPTLLFRVDPPTDNFLANRLLISPPLPTEELTALAEADPRAARVGAQLGARLLGDLDLPVAAALTAFFTGLFTVIGFMRGHRRLARSCEKCGRPVCRKCDPDLSPASSFCNQCVHVYTRASTVPPPIRVRKQIEVQNFRGRMNRTAYVLGALLSGTGHVFAGFPLQGALYLFLFLFLAGGVVFPQGVIRVPYGPVPAWLRLIPTVLLLSFVYARSLRGLYRKQGG